MSDSDADKIRPADLSLTDRQAPPEAGESAAPPLGMDDFSKADERHRQQSLLLAGIFALLLFLALTVIFVLPRYAGPSGGETGEAAVSAPPPATPAAPANQVSPFEEAQRFRQREAAQNALAELLKLQEELEKVEVNVWAESGMERVFELAAHGDEAYRQQDFAAARDHYQQGLGILQDLKARIPEIFAGFMEQGAAAMTNGDPTGAERAFSMALLLDPASEEAFRYYDRSLVLGEVLALLASGAARHDEGQLEAARDYYQQALAVDGEHPEARQSLRQVNAQLRERDFASLMSRGFATLSEDRFAEAETAFERALALMPASPEAEAALQQAVEQKNFTLIGAHLAAAENFAAAEDWQQAASEYDKALAIDPNLVSAKEGRQNAGSRSNLDQFLLELLQDPLRLAEDEVYQQALGIYGEAVRIPAAGPRLGDQLQRLLAYLEKARQPLEVRLQSDGQTAVTVYGVGSLGQFTSYSLALIPGRYTAVGARDGYRDVREEFVVDFDAQAPVVTIQCVEEVL